MRAPALLAPSAAFVNFLTYYFPRLFSRVAFERSPRSRTSNPRRVHVDTDATRGEASSQAVMSPRLTNRERQPLTAVESYDIYIPHRPVSAALALRLYQALNLGQAVFFLV